MDEASDMLKLPPGLADLAEEAEGGKASQAMKNMKVSRQPNLSCAQPLRARPKTCPTTEELESPETQEALMV